MEVDHDDLPTGVQLEVARQQPQPSTSSGRSTLNQTSNTRVTSTTVTGMNQGLNQTNRNQLAISSFIPKKIPVSTKKNLTIS